MGRGGRLEKGLIRDQEVDRLRLMIISHGRRYIFVHIPKTGGTSMALALEARAKADDILIGDTPKAKRRKRRLKDVRTVGRLWKHSTLANVEGLITEKEMAEFFVFTLVRNPWDRIVSLYHWLQTQNFDHPMVPLAHGLDFERFVTHAEVAQRVRAQPYRAFTRGPSGVDHADAYLRLEHLEEDLAPLEAHLGFRLQIPVENASDRRANYRSYYSDRAQEAVAQACAEDIARFGYAFG